MAGTELAVVERCIAEDRYINGCFLKLTCTSYPEQYDVFLGDEGGEQIGYLRLRHGYFRAEYPDVLGYEVYGSELASGHRFGGRGEFEDHERLHQLTEAVNALLNHHWKVTPIDGECRVIEDSDACTDVGVEPIRTIEMEVPVLKNSIEVFLAQWQMLLIGKEKLQ